jgi:hypothetical protein
LERAATFRAIGDLEAAELELSKLLKEAPEHGAVAAANRGAIREKLGKA